MRPRNWWIISAAALAAERLVDATKEAKETSIAAAAAAALSAPDRVGGLKSVLHAKKMRGCLCVCVCARARARDVDMCL